MQDVAHCPWTVLYAHVNTYFFSFLYLKMFLTILTRKSIKTLLQDGQNFETIRDDQGIIIIYQGNIDSSSYTEYQFDPRIYSRLLRLVPVRWEPSEDLYISLRWELYVCRKYKARLIFIQNQFIEK